MNKQPACGVLVKQIHDNMEKQVNNALRALDLTMAQFGVLVELIRTEDGTLSLKELERRLHVAQSTAAGIVLRLEQKELVESQGDVSDRRIKLVRVTAKGRTCFHSADLEMSHLEEVLLHALSNQEQAELHRLLEKLCSSLS